jgi:flagellar hook protein FlgE
MSRALSTAVSGLRNHQLWLDVIGNNIANANTPGFKSSNVVFTDILGQTLSTGIAPTAEQGGTNPTQVGLGVTLGSIATNFLQGSIQTTNRSTDLAIQGDGFFVLADGTDRLYTRAGAFTLDANGSLVDSTTGFRVLGANGEIRITQGQESAPVATATANFRGNLDYAVPDGTQHVATFNVLDSVGGSHALTMTFTKNFAASPGQWDWGVTAADPAIASLSGATGSVAFDANGAVAAGAAAILSIDYAVGAGVASPQTVTLDFGGPSNPTPVTGLASPSTLTLAAQDGQPPGTLRGFAIGRDGVITGFYSNGTTAVVDTIQLATFANAGGLLKVGSNLFRESATSGLANVGDPGTADRGTLSGGALEMSNVDLAQEFTNMILAQRGFQANARTISTANEMLEELVNLKR